MSILRNLIHYSLVILATNSQAMEIDQRDSSPSQSYSQETIESSESISEEDRRPLKKPKIEKSTSNDPLLFSFINLTSELVECTLFPKFCEYDSCYGGDYRSLGDKDGLKKLFNFNGKINDVHLRDINGVFENEKIFNGSVGEKDNDGDQYYFLAGEFETEKKKEIIKIGNMRGLPLAGPYQGWGKCFVLHTVYFHNPYDYCHLYNPPKFEDQNLLVFSEVDISSYVYKLYLLRNATGDFYHFPKELKRLVYADLFLCSLDVGIFKGFYS